MQVKDGLDKHNTIVWQLAVDAFRAAEILIEREETQAFVNAHMRQVISILLDQTCNKVSVNMYYILYRICVSCIYVSTLVDSAVVVLFCTDAQYQVATCYSSICDYCTGCCSAFCNTCKTSSLQAVYV
jgi:hypothetical protein